MDHWGYSIQPDRQNIYEQGDFSLLDRVMQQEPSVRACVSCGTCSATCTAATNGCNLRRLILDVYRGNVQQACEAAERCLFCGKCILVCPRGVNTRNVILIVKKESRRNVLR